MANEANGTIYYDFPSGASHSVVPPLSEPIYQNPNPVDPALNYPVIRGEKGEAGVQGPTGADGIDAATQLVRDENPAGAIDGSNATFTLSFPFVPESVVARINGISQRLLTDFNTSGTTTVFFSESPLPGDSIRIDYLKA